LNPDRGGTLSGSHLIVVPPEKDPLPKRSGLHSVARFLGSVGFIGFGTVITAIVGEYPGLWDDARFIWVAVVGLACFAIAWRREVLGGALLLASMILDGFLIPNTLLGWRLVAQGCTLYLSLVGLLFLIASRYRE
jgi:hypothetical protein